MIKVKNLKIYQGLPFDKYLALPGLSFSGIMSEGVSFKNETKKMRFGTLVHTHLNLPEEYSGEQEELVVPISTEIRRKIGPLMDLLEPELSFTCEFHFNGMFIRYKGRADLSILERLIIDIKVSDMPLKKALDYFKYDRQQSGYSIALGASVALILSISPKTKFISIYNVPISHTWWEHQILKRGEPA